MSCIVRAASISRRAVFLSMGCAGRCTRRVARGRALAVRTPAERLIAEQLAPSLAKLDTATNQLALQAAARAALINMPAQRLARRVVVDQLKLIDNPVQRLARQVTDSMPKLDIAADLHQSSGRDEAVDELEQPDAPEARAEGTSDAPSDDHEGECPQRRWTVRSKPSRKDV
ncbi:hypothetical protein OG440_40640 (plasmid) [Streptomyces sp. NBC_00637]|uniref:hypothetical protein n=1 Tax=Streptomyces sp. NBC_00637 TaxID=2903667 RepID=UPI00324AE250